MRFPLRFTSSLLFLASVVMAQAPSTVLVDTIPASARYAIYVTLAPKNPTMKPEEAAAVGKNLSGSLPQLRQMARQRGANLVVLLGAEHGIAVPLEGVRKPLILRGDNPAIIALFFRWDGAPSPTNSERSVRFTTDPAPLDKDLSGMELKKIVESIDLKSAPPNADLPMWVYMNLARFVKDAVQHDFDTISVGSTNDPSFQPVWIPGCDKPVRISKTKPTLSVTLYKRPVAVAAPR